MESQASIEIRSLMLQELSNAFCSVREQEIEGLINEIMQANRIFIYGLGRERLMLQAFGMRLMHLGFHVHIVGDVTTPGIQAGDLWITSSGTGKLATVDALMNIVKASKARVVFFTAFPIAELPRRANLIVHIPAQTMREGEDKIKSIQPLGSIFEQTQLLVFDLVVVLLARKMQQTEASMAGRHTNLE